VAPWLNDMTKRPLNESTPGEQAHALGLEYGGFGGWIDPKTRVVKARTIDGKLVRVDDDESPEGEDNKGRLIVLDVDDNLLYADMKKPSQTVENYIHLLRALVKTGQDVVLLHARNSEKKLAQFLKTNGITSGPTLLPIGSGTPDKKQEFIEKKIKEGYKEVQFFDRDPKAIHAVEALKAPFNKRDVQIETHQIPPISADSRAKPDNDKNPAPSAPPNSQ
jgi:hypothetical protein